MHTNVPDCDLHPSLLITCNIVVNLTTQFGWQTLVPHALLLNLGIIAYTYSEINYLFILEKSNGLYVVLFVKPLFVSQRKQVGYSIIYVAYSGLWWFSQMMVSDVIVF